ncbi:MAG: lytic transglycosylase domain-containing protein [Rubrobacteraceae bacterium]
MRETENEVAQEDIFVQPLEHVSRATYLSLYQKAARDYGFARDWYILAAVGKVESNHGENMGPSSAGAMGPMQFLPSTWESSGVDGNGDGKANIMDPRDAIPAAAGYLRDGGAPDDWYAALYSYNHADWYVKEVLAVAETYRKAAKDDRVGPYV